MSDEQKQQSSGMPPIEEIREAQTMRIYTVNTSPFERKIVETTLIAANPNKVHKRRPIVATLIKLEDDRVKEYMPSKVWGNPVTSTAFSQSPTNFDVLFYVNASMPQTVRPFKENTYLLFFVPESEDVIEYDVNLRIFMDQVPVDGLGMTYVIMFGEETYKELIVAQREL